MITLELYWPSTWSSIQEETKIVLTDRQMDSVEIIFLADGVEVQIMSGLTIPQSRSPIRDEIT